MDHQKHHSVGSVIRLQLRAGCAALPAPIVTAVASASSSGTISRPNGSSATGIILEAPETQRDPDELHGLELERDRDDQDEHDERREQVRDR
jgi:hypothetical protein